MRPTLRTVADAVGVSRSTVSNAYSRPDQLSPDLREKIFEAARRLGYAGPDPAARSLRRGRVGAIG
ncbi:MAG TPA: LacI family DNA-binding transcriptional regulator, partial [Asanoa sp.]